MSINLEQRPKRAMTAFFIWMREARDAYKKPGMTVSEAAKSAGIEWAKLKDKSIWEQKAAEDSARYKREMAEYQNNASTSPIKVTVCTQDGQEFPILISRDADVNQLEKVAKVHAGIPSKEFAQLSLDDVILKSGSLADNGVENGSILKLGQEVSTTFDYNPVKVNVVMEDGKYVSILINRRETVDKLKLLVEAYTGVQVEKQELMFNGYKMNDGILEDAGIQDGVPILLRQRNVE